MNTKDERFYLISYDIRDDKRWRKLFRTLNGYGEWRQLSVFLCRLSRKRKVMLEAAVREIIAHGEDHVLFVDMGPATGDITPVVLSIGRPFEPIIRKPVIV